MSTSSQDRAEAKARVLAKRRAEQAMSARERIYHILCATHPAPEAEAMVVAVEQAVRGLGAEVVRSLTPKGTDDESKAVAHALNLAADAVERGRR